MKDLIKYLKEQVIVRVLITMLAFLLFILAIFIGLLLS
jgi:hypothetical protein